jgi:hypothetical protein
VTRTVTTMTMTVTTRCELLLVCESVRMHACVRAVCASGVSERCVRAMCASGVCERCVRAESLVCTPWLYALSSM